MKVLDIQYGCGCGGSGGGTQGTPKPKIVKKPK